MPSPFTNPILLDWFFHEEAAEPRPAAFPSQAVTAGSGPFAEKDFDLFLLGHHVEPHEIGSDLDVFIVGREAGESDSLEFQLEVRRKKQLRLYSQEMFLSYLKTGRDPYESPEILLAFSDHPALSFAEAWGFSWPTTQIVPGAGFDAQDTDSSSWPPVGLLAHLGYKVGKDGVARASRQSILRRVFTSSVPNVDSPAYMNQWGAPKTPTRLHKLANAIAGFAKNAIKNHGADNAKAIHEWREDLDWLEITYYRSLRFVFEWPNFPSVTDPHN